VVKIVLKEPLNGDNVRSTKDISTALTLAGFINISNTTQDSAGAIEFIASKPAWEIGAKATLSFVNRGGTQPLKKQKQETTVWTLSTDDTVDEDINVGVITPKELASVWKISADDDDDDELENEDALLAVEDFVRPSASDLITKKDDCEVGKGGKKKACKNCTCGRAEGEMEEQAEETKSAPASACGSCYLGDAFRCASCPYLGLAPFKPGDKLKPGDKVTIQL